MKAGYIKPETIILTIQLNSILMVCLTLEKVDTKVN